MPTSYTTLLGLAKPQTGELSGTWGDTVNSYITEYLDGAVAGAQVISGSQTAVTLSTTNGSALVQAGAAAAGSSQYAIIRCTGNPASMLTITAPATSKTYLVVNATSTNQDVKIVGAGPTTGVIIPPSRSGLVFWNGADFQIGPVAGPASSTDNAVARFDGTTGKVVQNSSVVIDDSNNITGIVDETLSGNLNFTGTAKRITGDFSNATLASRVMFQTSTTNGATVVSALPNGTSTDAALVVYNGNDPANSASGSMYANAADVRIAADKVGTGTYLPLTFYTGGSERVRIDTSGNVGIGANATNRLSLTYNGGTGEATFGPNSTSGSTFLTLGTSNAGSYSERVRIDASGNVGIGNTPSVKLDVQGAGTIRGFLTTTDAIKLGANTSAPTTTDAFIYRPADNTLGFGTASAERMRITSAGLLQFNSGYGSVATAFGCRAWVNFDGTGTPALRGNGNVSSITDNGVGDYTVNFTTAIVDANYAFTGAAESNIVGDSRIVTAINGGISSSSCRITVRSDTNVAQDCPTVTFVVHR